MSGPLGRWMGILGLILLAPTAWMLATGAISGVDAGIRAILTLLGVAVLGRILNWAFKRAAVAASRGRLVVTRVTEEGEGT